MFKSLENACLKIMSENQKDCEDSIPFPKNEEVIFKSEKIPFNIDEQKKKLEILGEEISKLIKENVELESHKLQYFRVTQDTICPMLFNTTGIREAIYKDGLIFVGSEKLHFQSDADEALASAVLKENDEMVFYKSYPYFHVSKKDKYEEYQKTKKELQEVRQKKNSISSQYESIREEIEKYEFWEQYKIPFKFVVDIKPVLSGLTERSWGNGCNRATVYHVRLRENITLGKLSRNSEDYLCSQQSGNAYYNISRVDINDIQDVVTCKQCLKIIEKYKKV